MKLRLLMTAVGIAALLTSTGASANSWYVSVLGGETIAAPRIDLGPSVAYRNDGFNAGGRIGYTLDDWVPWSGFSLEGDVFYNHSTVDGSPRLALSSLSGMGNLIYHFNTPWRVGVYGGAGAGVVDTRVSNIERDNNAVFGWQAIGGVDYRFSPEATMFAEYRYQNAHDVNLTYAPGVSGPVSNTSNNVSVGLKFAMDDFL